MCSLRGSLVAGITSSAASARRRARPTSSSACIIIIVCIIMCLLRGSRVADTISFAASARRRARPTSSSAWCSPTSSPPPSHCILAPLSSSTSSSAYSCTPALETVVSVRANPLTLRPPRRHRVGLYKILFHSFLYMHDSIFPLSPPPICMTWTTAILLRDFCAIYDLPPTLPVEAVHYTILVMAISCKGQPSRCVLAPLSFSTSSSAYSCTPALETVVTVRVNPLTLRPPRRHRAAPGLHRPFPRAAAHTHVSYVLNSRLGRAIKGAAQSVSAARVLSY